MNIKTIASMLFGPLTIATFWFVENHFGPFWYKVSVAIFILFFMLLPAWWMMREKRKPS